ncbi:MAG TPA: phosphatidate cytidylyltransferase [Clostridia bacterium]|nr:phosphatidate cytidylyltransferase [Clostridia bacterium]
MRRINKKETLGDHMLSKRILSALIGIPLLLFITYQGDYYLLLAVFILSILALSEFRNISNKAQCKIMVLPMWVSVLILPVVYLFHYQYIANILFFYLVFCYLYFLLYYPRYSPLGLSFTLFGALYIAWGFFHLVLLRQMEAGFWLILYVFLVVWSTDSGAYFIGIVTGKHKWAPTISPKKSWEGVVGGLLVSFLAVWLYCRFVPGFSPAQTKILLGITPFVSFIGQCGDLLESTLKRHADLKDSGQLIPGHGGILDRFDSMLLAAPFTYYLFNLLERMM